MSNSRLNITINEGVVLLDGVIDELSDFSPIVKSTVNPVVFNLEGIQRINSYGIKNWILMLSELKERDIVYQNCPVCIIEQINLVPDIRGNAKIDSFFLPFFCPDCEEEVNIKINFDATQKASFFETLDDSYDCEDCGCKMEFYDDVDLYFDFLNT